jgi:hypothetical protein
VGPAVNAPTFDGKGCVGTAGYVRFCRSGSVTGPLPEQAEAAGLHSAVHSCPGSRGDGAHDGMHDQPSYMRLACHGETRRHRVVAVRWRREFRDPELR